MKQVNENFLKDVSQILLAAKENAKAAVNLSMVYAYYEIGRKIFEEEQGGESRAAYGKYLLKELSAYLTGIFGKDYSADNLRLMRRFYTVYVKDQIGKTMFPQFKNLPTVSSGRRFYLSWSHYLKLKRIKNIDERLFYEIEAIKNNWNLGILLCRDKNDAIVQMTLPEDNNQTFASKYEEVLPSKKELQKLLEEHLSEEDDTE